MRALTGAILVATLAGRAHALDPDFPLSQLQVTAFQRDRGFPATTVLAVAQTPDGSLWVGTVFGLIRYDGRRFTAIRRATHPGLPSDTIRALAVDGDALWIGTSAGLARLERGALMPVASAALQGQRIEVLHQDHAGRLWISTSRTVLRREGDALVAVVDDAGAPTGPARDFAEAGDGTMWMIGPLRRWRGGRLATVDDTPLDVLTDDGQGGVLAFGRGKLLHVEGDHIERQTWPEEQFNDAERDAGGTVYLTSAGGGLFRRRTDGRLDRLTTEQGLPTDTLEILSVDRDGTLWVGANLAGLLRLRQPRVLTHSVAEGLPDRAVMQVVATGDGAILASTAKGTTRIEGGRAVPLPWLPAKLLASLHEDRRGRVWFSDGDGLFRAEAGGAPVRVSDDLVLSMADDADGGLWLASPASLLHVRGDVVDRRLPGKQLTVVHVARDGAVWLGGRGGVCRLAAGEAEPRCFVPAEGGPAGLVLAIHEDARGVLWLGTHEDGLYRVAAGRFFRFSDEHGLPTNTHYAVVEDDHGQLWTSSDSGILRLDRASLDRIAEGAREPAIARAFDERDGMRSAECMGGGPTAARGTDGRLWFATAAGAVAIDPALPDPTPPVLSPHIEAVRASGRALFAPAAVELDASAASLRIEFVAPSLQFGGDITFRHHMQGFDRDWVSSDEPSASYGNLPHGRYRFEVQARVAPADWGPAAAIAVTVPAPWSQTPWFRAVLLAAVLLLAYAAHRWRLAWMVRRHRRLEAIVAERTGELATAKHALEEANATLEERVERAVTSLREAERMAAYGHMVAGVAHEVKQPLFALGNAVYVLGTKLEGRPDVAATLSLAQREARRMNHIMDELLDFARPAALEKVTIPALRILREAAELYQAEHDPDRALAVSIDADGLPAAPLDEARLIQTVVNLMANARKHAAGATRITLSAALAGDRLRLEVDNDGAPIPPDVLPHIFEPFFTSGDGRGTGLGLAIVHRIVKEHGGEITATSGPSGTRFSIDLPAA